MRGLIGIASVAALALGAPAPGRVPFPAFAPGSGKVTITADDVCDRAGSADEDEAVVCGRPPLGGEELRRLHVYARCLAVTRPERARAMLALPYEQAVYRRALTDLARWSQRCAPVGDLKVSALLVAGAVAEALLWPIERERSLAAATAFADGQAPVRAGSEAEAMSLCLVRTAAPEAEALLVAPAGTAEEASAFAALRPRLDGCLRRGVKLLTTPAGLRAQIALAAWRLARTKET